MRYAVLPGAQLNTRPCYDPAYRSQAQAELAALTSAARSCNLGVHPRPVTRANPGDDLGPDFGRRGERTNDPTDGPTREAMNQSLIDERRPGHTHFCLRPAVLQLAIAHRIPGTRAMRGVDAYTARDMRIRR